MSRTRQSLDEIQSRQRDLWVLFGLVFAALVASAALSLGALESVVEQRLGRPVPAWAVPVALVLALGGILYWAWLKTQQTLRMIGGLDLERGRSEGLRVRLQTVHCILEASSKLRMEQDVADGLRAILQEVAVALRADRVVLYRVSRDDSHLERDAVYPSSPTAAPRATLDFEDRVARAVVTAGRELIVPGKEELDEYGIETPPPGEGFRSLVAAPLVLDDRARGVLVVRNPESLCEACWTEGDTELLEIFASCAAGVLRNLRRFQASGQRIEELEEAVQNLERRRISDVEVRTAATMTRIACSAAHALAGPLTAIRGYVDVLRDAAGDAETIERARHGMNAEQLRMKHRLQDLVDFTATWASRFELVDIGAAASEQIDAVRPQLRQKGVPVVLDLYERPPLTMVDVPRFHLVMAAMARFACQSLLRGGDEAQLSVRTIPHSGRIRTEFALRDARIEPDELEPLFEPNVEAGQLRRPGALELAVASSVIRTHQGTVEASTGREGELVLCIDLPIRRDRPPRPQRTFPVVQGEDSMAPVEVLEELLLVGEGMVNTGVELRSAGAAPAAEGSAAIGEAPSTGAAPEALPGAAPADPSAPPPVESLDLWGHDEAPPPPAPPPKKTGESRSTEPLLDQDDVENALSLFDDASRA